jgi:threonine/homoserine/homoserine lactone efflux protein
MKWELLPALLAFAFISSWSPGPNNTLLMASGINHGLRKTLPMIFGVMIGFSAMVAIVGVGLGKVFEAYPIIYTVMKYAGAAYMLYLAWKIASSTPKDGNTSSAPPMTFLQAAGFQWINPKGWTMAIASLTTYTIPTNYNLGVAAVSLSFLIAGLGSSFAWTTFGTVLRRFLTNPKWFRVINIILALTLVASLVPMLMH